MTEAEARGANEAATAAALASAREQRAAVSDILRVIARSPKDLQAVFDVIATSARRFCSAEDAMVGLVEGDRLVGKAHDGAVGWVVGSALLDRQLPAARCIVDRRTIHVLDMSSDTSEEFRSAREIAMKHGIRTVLATPMLHDGKAIGSITLRRLEVLPFTDEQIELVRTFADQAAIAIENVRLFNETKEALDQQTATNDVLRTISRSAFDLQAVFTVVLENATKLCRGEWAWLYRREGDVFRLIAWHGGSDALLDYERTHPTAITDRTLIGRVALRRSVVHIPDLFEDPSYEWPSTREQGVHTVLGVPIFRDDEVVGAIGVARGERRPFSDAEIRLVQAFADQATIAMENVRLFNETKESLAQQTALSEVLNTISRSAFDLDAVLQTIVERAAALCDADGSAIFRRTGDVAVLAASFGGASIPGVPGSTLPIDNRTLVGRAMLTGEKQYVPDAREHPELPQDGPNTRLNIPFVRDGVAIGALGVVRRIARPFTERELSLFEVFADQAAIAIENVRLFNETKEALAQQTAVSEVLKTISRSAFDLTPVLDIVLNNAVRLAGADIGWLSRVEGEQFTTVAFSSEFPQAMRDELALRRAPGQVDGPWVPLGPRGGVMGFTLAERRTIHLADVRDDQDLKGSVIVRLTETRTVVGVPMLREGRSVGAIVLARYEVRPFSEREIELVQTFTDQAAIAIENVRLFNETKEALERQTAVAQVLDAISQSAFELQPVLETVIEYATKLCAAQQGFIYRREGDRYRLAVAHGITPEFRAFTEANPVDPAGRGTVTGRVVQDRMTVHVPDVLKDPEYTYWDAQRLGDFRALLGVPMIREDEVIGVMLLWRTEPQPFTAEEIALVTTFASQATIAIENVRLFDETKEALKQQTAVSEVLKAISRSAFDLDPILDTVVENAARLADADFAWMIRRDGDQVLGGARYASDGDLSVFAELGTSVARFNPKGQSVTRFAPTSRSISGRTFVERRTIHVEDITVDKDLFENSPVPRATASRTVLAVPLLVEGEAIGVIIVARRTVRPLSAREVQVVETFADQAAIAIQNVRLFNEIQDKSSQLEVANRHKSEFLANMSHELRTPLNAIIGFSEVLLESMFGDINAKQREYLQDVLGSGQHLLSLINDILDLSKIEAGRMELELTEFPFRAALDSGLTIVRERASRHRIELNAVVASDVDTIEADERKVKQILYNLLSNAVKFTPDSGRVDVSVRAENGDVRVEVRDTGIGVAPDDQKRIFEEFRQVGRERSREGTGLGLTLTKRFVELHGGRIWLESSPGKGSTFGFTLPLRRAAAVSA